MPGKYKKKKRNERSGCPLGMYCVLLPSFYSWASSNNRNTPLRVVLKGGCIHLLWGGSKKNSTELLDAAAFGGIYRRNGIGYYSAVCQSQKCHPLGCYYRRL